MGKQKAIITENMDESFSMQKTIETLLGHGIISDYDAKKLEIKIG